MAHTRDPVAEVEVTVTVFTLIADSPDQLPVGEPPFVVLRRLTDEVARAA